jgi:hypothetical protein
MAMSQDEDISSIDKDFEDSELQVLDPSVAIRTPVSTNGRKRKNAKPAGPPAGNSRGRAWREDDSILLVKAYSWVEETKKGTAFSDHVLMKDWESQPIQESNIYKHWLFLDPDEKARTPTAVISCWKDMISMFKYFPCRIFIAYCRYIVSFDYQDFRLNRPSKVVSIA